MASLKIELEWFRHAHGYRLTRARDVARATGDDPRSYPDVDWIVPNSDDRVAYRPLEENDLICVAFSKVKTPDHLLNFINMFGPLTRSSPQWGDSVDDCLNFAGRFRELLISKEKGHRKIAAVFHSQLREREKRFYRTAFQKDPPRDYDFSTLSHWAGQADIVADVRRGVQIRINADELIGALWLQLAQKLSGDKNFRMCRQCGALFETGPGTGKHFDASFCCSAHKVRYFSLARTKREDRGRRTAD